METHAQPQNQKTNNQLAILSSDVGVTDYGEGSVVHSFGNDTSDQIHWPEEGNDLTAAVFGVDDAALDDIEEALAETIWSFGASVRTAGLAAVRRSAIQPPL